MHSVSTLIKTVVLRAMLITVCLRCSNLQKSNQIYPIVRPLFGREFLIDCSSVSVIIPKTNAVKLSKLVIYINIVLFRVPSLCQ